MTQSESQSQRANHSQQLKLFVKSLAIDLVGIADLKLLAGMPMGLLRDFTRFRKRYPFAIVLGAQLGKLGNNATAWKSRSFYTRLLWR